MLRYGNGPQKKSCGGRGAVTKHGIDLSIEVNAVCRANRFVQARMASPDSCRRCISAASSDRRSTLPSVDVSGIPLLLDGRRRNLSDPQLHAVPLALRGRQAIYPSQPRSGPLHVGLRRKLTAPADINDASFLHRSLASGMFAHCTFSLFDTIQ